MSSLHECPICMENINGNVNMVITECGHCFHTNCLMTNVAHNGFGCPFCRTKMTEIIKNEDDSGDNMSFSESDNSMINYTLPSDNALRGFRFLFQRITGEELTLPNDNSSEEEYDEIINTIQNTQNPNESFLPSIELIKHKLTMQGITMEHLIKALCSYHEEYEDFYEFQQAESEIFGKLRIIVSNFETYQENEVTTTTPIIVETETPTNNIITTNKLTDSWFENRFMRIT